MKKFQLRQEYPYLVMEQISVQEWGCKQDDIGQRLILRARNIVNNFSGFIFTAGNLSFSLKTY